MLPSIFCLGGSCFDSVAILGVTLFVLVHLTSDLVMRERLLQEQLEGTLCNLREDRDNDVRCSAGGEAILRCLTINSASSESEEPWFQEQGDHPSVELRGLRGLGFQQTTVENEGLQDVNNIEDSVFEVAQQFNEALAEEKMVEGERKEVDGEKRREVEKVEEEGTTKEEVKFPSTCRERKVISVQIRGGEVVKWTKMGSGEGQCGSTSTEGE